ncbi:hypothetical protein [Crenobacter cavernae]|nr:hypothetical protein [Crenobacter cavernae]
MKKCIRWIVAVLAVATVGVAAGCANTGGGYGGTAPPYERSGGGGGGY